MSGTQCATATSATSNFTSIFEAASKEYKKLTKEILNTHFLWSSTAAIRLEHILKAGRNLRRNP
jgi:hypothetical protein